MHGRIEAGTVLELTGDAVEPPRFPVIPKRPSAPFGYVVDELSPKELARLMARPHSERVLLLDVREPDEREVARIEPSLHIPLQQVPDRLAEISPDRRVVVYCHHGHRSAMVAAYLEQKGYPAVANLTGGIDSWSATVDRKVPRYH